VEKGQVLGSTSLSPQLQSGDLNPSSIPRPSDGYAARSSADSISTPQENRQPYIEIVGDVALRQTIWPLGRQMHIVVRRILPAANVAPEVVQREVQRKAPSFTSIRP